MMHLEAPTSRSSDCLPQARCWQANRRRCQQFPSNSRLFTLTSYHRPQNSVQGIVRSAASSTPWKQQDSEDLQDYAIVPLEDNTPVSKRPGYRSFQMDTCELLVAETPDGQLELSDSYVLDTDSDVFARPMTSGELPQGPRHYQSFEVGAEYLGNVLEDKPPKHWVYKVYFLHVKTLEPYELDLKEVYVMDDKSRIFSKETVTWLAPEDTAPHDLRLRISMASVQICRKGVLTVESVVSLPSWEDVVCAQNSGLSALSEVEKDMLDRAAAGELSWADVVAVVGEEYARIWQAPEAYEYGLGSQPNGIAAAESLQDAMMDDKYAIDENLKDMFPEYDDENEDAYEDFDSPAVDY